MLDFAKLRQRAGVTQVEAAVRARVSPPLARAFERHGDAGVPDEQKRRRLRDVYEGFRQEAEKENAA
jgi:hypothetical protein